MKKYLKNISEQGSMMVEALAMLGLITMVTPILYKKAAERTTELQDINTATQLRTMSKALDDYIKDNYTTLKDDMASDKANIDPDDIKDYLPYNFETKSKLFNDFSFSIKKSTIPAADGGEGTASFTGVVLAPLADEGDLPRIRASKIASMVGANGGIVEGTDIKGVQGTWNAPVADFIFKDADGDDIDVQPNSLAISSVHAVTSSIGIASEAAPSEDVLHRTPQDDPLLNTMETALLMGGNDIRDVVKIIAKGEEGITLDGKVVAYGDITASGELGGGTANITGLLTAGSANISGALGVEGLSTLEGGVKTDTITANTEGSPITLSSDVEANEKVTVKQGIIAKGTAETHDEINYALVVKENNLLVENNAQINGDVAVNSTLTAKKLYGDEELGGGFISDGAGYNFVARNNKVTIVKPEFSLGNEDDGYTYIKTDLGSANIKSDMVNITGQTNVNIVGDTKIGDFYDRANINVAGMIGEILLDADKKINAKVVQGSNVYAELDLSETGFEMGSNNTKVSGNNSGFTLSTANETSTSSISGNSSGFTLSTATETSTSSISGNSEGVYASGKNVMLNASSGGKVTIDAPELVYQLGGTNFQYFHMDPDEMIFDNTSTSPTLEAKDVRASGVRINRAGIIDLPMAAGTGKTAMENDVGALSVPGYIRADRLVSNVAYPKMGEYWGVGGSDKDTDYNSAAKSDTNVSKPYDAYQVNPAYTSVMHDIKLTTRGGARLSDILPDFINKGIYVLDNTYKETIGSKNWEDYVVNPTLGEGSADTMVSGKPGECDSPDCIASPWLGFVPTPQCPPGYSKVITISPIRWKMSEAYYVTGNKAISAANLKDDNGANFRKYFFAPTNPLTEQFTIEIEGATATNGSEHAHTARVLGYEDGDPELDYAIPLTFQTNTWLNTTISGVYVDGESNTAAESGKTGGQRMSTFVGWHAIMGFLYPAADYEDYLRGLGDWQDSWKDNGTIIWNLFPVYNEEMTAIANVYCYFERRIWSGDTAWEWNNEYVDGGGIVKSDGSITPGVGYDQLTNFRSGFEKNNAPYNKRLNDPALGYDEVW